MAEVAGTILNADSSEDPGVIVQHLGEERGHGLIAAKSFIKGQTILREKVIMKTPVNVQLNETPTIFKFFIYYLNTNLYDPLICSL